MERRKGCWYSIVRYCADQLSGEVVNVGVILHSLDDSVETKFLFLDENSPKIRAVTNTLTDINIYKSFKESLEYYLLKSTENLLGEVGRVYISSPEQENFLNDLAKSTEDKKMFLSEPNFSLSSNPERLFSKLFETYIGPKYLQAEDKHVTVKKYLHDIFEERNLLQKKVAQDFSLSPIQGLNNVIKINIDFGYKNGVWNYLQAVPRLSGPSKNTEWYAKTKFMFDNISPDAKIHLIYRQSEIDDQEAEVLNYFAQLDEGRINKLNLDQHEKVVEMCETIERDAHDIHEVLIS